MAHFVGFNKSDVVLDKLKCLNSLDEMLFVKVLLLVTAVILLCNFCDKLRQGISRALLLSLLLLDNFIINTTAHYQRVSIGRLTLVTLETIFKIICFMILNTVNILWIVVEGGRVAPISNIIILVIVVLDAEF